MTDILRWLLLMNGLRAVLRSLTEICIEEAETLEASFAIV